MDKSVFGTYSFMIKPEKLRYIIERIPNPTPVADLGYGTGRMIIR
jgi:hypothetical protein